MYINGYEPQNGLHVLEARDMLEGEFEICLPDPPQKKLLPRPNAWLDYHPPEQQAINFAIKRGLTQREIEKFKFGQNKSYLAMPTFEYNTLKGIKFRNMGQTGLRFFSMKGSIHGLFNHDAVAYTPEPLAIVKGEIPVAVLDRFGILACAPDSGEMSSIAPWKHIFALAKKIIVIGDLDPDPRTRTRIVQKTKERAETVGGEVHFPPEGFDIDGWILSDPENVIPIIKGWMEN